MANPSNTIVVENQVSRTKVELKLNTMYLQWGGHFEVRITQNVGAENEMTLPVMQGHKSIDHNGLAVTEEDITALIEKSSLFEQLIPLFLGQAAAGYTE